MPPYLPPYQTAGYNAATGLNTGDLGFMRLPVERTTGGFRNNIFDPNSNPYPDGFSDSYADIGLDPNVNPFTQGYFSGGQWRPYLPDKIVYGQRAMPTMPNLGKATQTINGKEYNVNGNNYDAGQSGPAPYQYSTAPGDERTEGAVPFTGFGFGEAGKPGYSFMAGSMDNGRFYSKQPGLNQAPDRTLGTFQPWNPAAAALKQYRSQP